MNNKNNNYNNPQAGQILPIYSFSPSKSVMTAIGVIFAVLIVCGIFLYKFNVINVTSMGAFAIGAIFVTFDLGDKLGMVRMVRDCILYRAEITASERQGFQAGTEYLKRPGVPSAVHDAVSYENTFIYGENRTSRIFTADEKRVGEFIDVYINPKTGETLEKDFFEKHVENSRKSGVLILGIILIVLSIILEVIFRINLSEINVENLAAVFALEALLVAMSVYYLRIYVKMKREMGVSVSAITGKIVAYEQKEAADIEGIPIYKDYPLIAYWKDGEKTYYGPTSYSRKKYPVGSEIELYMDDKGNFYDAKTIKRRLASGITSAVMSVLIIVAVFVFSLLS